MSNISDDFKREIPHIIVLAVLVFILLFVVTKFKWVQCGQVPGDWCSVYCSVAGNSRVAMIQGDGAIGDSEEFSRLITKNRIFTYAERVPMKELSLGILKSYELIIVEGAKDVSPLQINAMKAYASSGGSVLWIGDAGTNHYLSGADLQDALNRNSTKPGYYEDVLDKLNKTKGFGEGISNLLQVNYQKNDEGQNLTLKIVTNDHPITKGLLKEFKINAKKIAIVNVNSQSSTILAYVYGTKDCTQSKPCPAIVAGRYAGPVIYMAFPPEEAGTKSLVTNMMDYLVTC